MSRQPIALWPGNYPAGHYTSALVFLGPFAVLLAVVLWKTIRITLAERKGHGGMELGPLGPVDPDTGKTPCPTRHAGVVEVRTEVDGQLVAHWCPDCGTQFPPDWTRPRTHSALLAERHDANHHGAPFINVYGCPRCGEEIMERMR